jgi:hypothetical protein
LRGLIGLLLLILLPQVPAWDQPDLGAAPVSEEAARGERGLGALAYAGGLYLTSSSSRFGGLSGLEAEALPEGQVRFHAVTDGGDFARFDGRLDAAGRLSGAGALTLTGLRDAEGRVLSAKRASDAEAISLLHDRPGFLVAYERDHRIVAYADPLAPDGGQAMVESPEPARRASANRGMEALAAMPGGVVAVGVEDGRLWLCPREAACIQVARGHEGGNGYSLTGLDALGPGELIAVYRSRSILRWGAKIAHIRIAGGKANVTILAEIAGAPGNLEGIAALPQDGGWRLYVVSDNGFSPAAPTLLLAFDWRR